MRFLLALALALYGTVCFGQKWVDDKGKIYYGDPPPGIKVKPAAMKGGATSSVGSQGGGSVPASGGGSLTQQEKDFQKRQAAREARERDERVMQHNREVMRNNQRVWKERYGK